MGKSFLPLIIYYLQAVKHRIVEVHLGADSKHVMALMVTPKFQNRQVFHISPIFTPQMGDLKQKHIKKNT